MPKNKPANKGTQPPKDPPLSPEIYPSPEAHDPRRERTACKPDQTPPWKMFLEGATFVAAISVAVIYSLQLRQMIASTSAAITASNAAVDTFENTVRPYITVTSSASIVNNPTPVLNFSASFKNYGTVPAQEVVIDWIVILDGKEEMHVNKIPDKPSMLPPGEPMVLVGTLGTKESPNVISGKKSLVFYASYSYKWRDKKESGCEAFKYFPDAKQFFDLGPSCAKK